MFNGTTSHPHMCVSVKRKLQANFYYVSHFVIWNIKNLLQNKSKQLFKMFQFTSVLTPTHVREAARQLE